MNVESFPRRGTRFLCFKGSAVKIVISHSLPPNPVSNPSPPFQKHVEPSVRGTTLGTADYCVLTILGL